MFWLKQLCFKKMGAEVTNLAYPKIQQLLKGLTHSALDLLPKACVIHFTNAQSNYSRFANAFKSGILQKIKFVLA